jgi:FSR family fosmidomycin resistance protein-like MFS transporter
VNGPASVLLLLILVLAHALVDLFAAMIQPLWPDLQRRLSLGEGTIQWAFVTWSLATSVSQLLFGFWGDRGRSRWLIWAGPALGVLCLSSIGLVRSLAELNILLVVGGLGIAAFHPEAAALAGTGTLANRSRAMSLFAVGGSIGQAIGPVYGGSLTTAFGLRALAWSMTWGFAVLGILVIGLRRTPGEPESVVAGQASAPAWRAIVRARGPAMGLVLLIGVLRILAVLGVPLALAFVLKSAGRSNEEIGLPQSLFLAGVGGGSLACALFVRRGGERQVLWLMPLFAVPLIWLIPWVGIGPALGADVGIAGLLLGATLPILVSHGQQLLPEAERTASSITMGLTWGLGGLIVAAAMAASSRLERPELPFAIFAVACLFSSLLCAWLPEPRAHYQAVSRAWAAQPR